MSRDERCEVGPVAELKSDGPEYDERKQAEFEKHQRAYEPAAEADAANVDERDGDDRRDGEKFCGPGREMDDVTGVRCESDGEGGSEAGIHYEKSHPAVHESECWSECLAQVDIAAAGFGKTRGEFAETGCAARAPPPNHEPDDQQPHRRAELFRHAGGGEKYFDSKNIPDD